MGATPISFPATPEIIADQVNRHYERVARDWGGRNLFLGRTPKRGEILMVSSDYLSLANHRRVVDAQIEELQRVGNGMMMSGLLVQQERSPNRILERELADFLKAEDCIVCQSGYTANAGLVQSLASKEVPIYIDSLAHMSFYAGIRRVEISVVPFRHNSMDSLEKRVAAYGPGIILVDSVYSTIGTVCPLQSVAEISQRFECVLVVDESHSLGTHGPRGKGMVVDKKLTGKVHFRTASLAKAFCGRGGIIAGNAREIDFIRFKAHPFIFSAAMLPHEVAGFRAILELISADSAGRKRLRYNARYLREGLIKLGYNLNGSRSQIVSLEPGTELCVRKARDALEREGIFGAAFGPPATAKKHSLIRFAVHRSLSRPDLERIVAVCDRIKPEVGMEQWPSTRRRR